MINKRIFDCYTIIPHTTESKVLVLRVKDGWSLPHFVPAKNHFAHVGLVNQAMHEQLGIDVTTLCCVYNDLDTESDRVNRVFVIENHTPGWNPPAEARWIDKYELDNLPLTVPVHRDVLKAWFNEVEDSKISTHRVPWARIGWFEKATIWIDEQLNSLGISVISPIEQLRSWGVSCVMRISTTAGNIYFKATPDVLGKEFLFTQTLAEYYPANFPKILAVEPEQHWILMLDFGGRILSEVTDVVQWEKALRLYAEIQIESVQHVDNLIRLGWPDRRLKTLSYFIELLLSDTEALQAGDFIIIEESDIDELRALIPKFKAMCDALASYNLPQTLVHGDFWAKNVVVTDDNNYIYFDWPTSAVAHPFFDIVNFLYIEKYVPDIPDVRTRLRNAYLEAWTIYEPMERLIEAFELSKTLGMLYQAITYYWIVSHLEELARWEMEVAVPLCLEKLLQRFSGE
ncbi:phosphotransferase family protein [Argonema antarcticum]|uniref:phosphotransferase family protein n=1 Tax=Argonema antarcticum TaxID=2942763 RepID=UPI0020128DCB|nr:aminoglycoside phosphotransferase family protein [Argonema antarcticum]MCL1469157.1 aminoglycoside phosphotransferase family protein [Argonema antarcticum A004/B2]